MRSRFERQRRVPQDARKHSDVIYFGDTLAAALTEHYERSTYKEQESFVFCSKSGSPFDPDVLRKDVLYPMLDRQGIARSKGASGFHTFRHSVASILNQRTGNLKLAQKLLGHSTVDMTANVYTHTSAEEDREASLEIERAICSDLFPICSQLGTNLVVRQSTELGGKEHGSCN